MKKAGDKKAPVVAVLMGSDSDWDTVKVTVETLAQFGIESEAQVISAHRTPVRAAEFARTAARRGIRVIIAAAGGAAHLAGVLAAHTTRPVIGIPIKGGALDGLDALLSTVQMPAGIPVATVALGKSGAVNAALLAVQILALGRADLRKKLKKQKRALERKVDEGNRRLRVEREKKK
ncbi:MAG: 5-(carboxyamino)imidazole ribonucleotide mutase [Verrucomicrobia bacterium A1]|nr:MAG: 5-(carboxyamino)imidazole ribonucleotide mutase [Verrucomicrobia bacterium A1]